MQMLKFGHTFLLLDVDQNLVEESFAISLQQILDSCTEEVINLFLCFGQNDIVSHDVCQFEIKGIMKG
jgi:hypothetical protein